MLYIFLAIALVFDFLNGFKDSSNIVATVISSHAMRPRTALLMTALAELVAPFLFGVAIANTVGRDLVSPEAISPPVVISAAAAGVFWNLITSLLGMPSSSSHALVGGLLGASILAEGVEVVQFSGLLKILISLLISPFLGLVVGFLLMNLNLYLFRNATPRINQFFRRVQIFTSLSLALSYGTNDAQKTMGIITLGLVVFGYQDSFHVPLWVIAACAGSIALGTALGGWRLIRTLGERIYKIRPIHAFSSQAASAAVILGATLLGGPVSTSQVVSSAIIGSGAAERLKMVRWQVAQSMLITWALTIPLTAIASGLIYLVFQRLF